MSADPGGGWVAAQPAWWRLAPDREARQAPGVRMSFGASEKIGARLFVSLRLEHLPALSWLERDGMVAAYFGTGGNSGRLRIGPGGALKLASLGRQTAVERHSLSLQLAPPAGLSGERQKPTPCAWEVLDDALVIEMPDWARPAPVAAPAPARGRRG